jgi:hypothetical protein
MRTTRLVLTAVLGAVATLGCGDGDGGGDALGRATSSSGVGSSKKINELSSAEFRKVCDGVGKQLDRIAEANQKMLCTAEALTEDEDNCADLRDECLEDAGPDDARPLDCEEPPAALTEECDATVAEFEACAEATVKAIERWASELTCSSDLDDFDREEVPDPPAACEKLSSECNVSPDLDDEEQRDADDDTE